MSTSHVPPGFRFHPTDEELVDYYLRKKVASRRIDLNVIKDIDLYKIEPWDLQDKCRIGAEEQSEWYFFSHKDKKYPTGTRTNRATAAGFWKATGRDKPIYAKHSLLVGMRKTLVYYQGRAPNGHKSDWIMHEYRLETNEHAPPQEEGWVVCRVFKKKVPATSRRDSELEPGCWYDDDGGSAGFLRELNSSFHGGAPPPLIMPQSFPFPSYRRDLRLQYQLPLGDPFSTQIPQLESPDVGLHSNVSPSSASGSSSQQLLASHAEPPAVTDWRILDKFVASQLSNGAADLLQQDVGVDEKQVEAADYAG